MKTNIFDYVLERLRDPETKLIDVCRDTGLKSSWLWQLKDGRIPDPSVRKIQALANYFHSSSKPKKAS